MTKQIRYSILGAFILLLACQTPLARKEECTECLQKISHSVRSINPSDTTFDDLIFLKEYIGEAQIVSLGELNHQDGSNFLAKTRLIKYLHEQLGFSVIVFESGMFDCMQAWKSFCQGEPADSSFSEGVFPVWAKSAELNQLISYMGQQALTTTPLELSGFDIQWTGKISFSKRKKLILTFLKHYNPNFDENQYTHFFKIFDSSSKLFKTNAFTRVDTVKQNQVFKDLTNLCKTLDTIKTKNKEDLITIRYLQTMSRYLNFTWNMDFKNDKIANIRDEEMGKNVVWLKNNIYPNKKIILWGANSHLSYNRNNLYYQDKMIPAGQYIKEKFTNNAYFILFTGYTGELGSAVTKSKSVVPDASNKSIEYLLHSSGVKYSIIDLQDLKNSACLDSSFVARPFGLANFKGKWGNMANALFFSDSIKPSHKAIATRVKRDWWTK